MSSAPSRSPPNRSSNRTTRPSSGSSSGVPLGLLIIVGIGFLDVVLGVFGGLGLLGQGDGGFGMFLLLFSGAKAVALVGLLRLQSWALTLAILFYGLKLIIDFITLDILGLIVGGIILYYFISIEDKFD